MKVAMWFWRLVMVLVFAWMLGAMSGISDEAETIKATPVPSEVGISQETSDVLTDAVAGWGMLFVMCVGIPVFLFSGLMEWRNRAGLRRRRERMETEARNALSGPELAPHDYNLRRW